MELDEIDTLANEATRRAGREDLARAIKVLRNLSYEELSQAVERFASDQELTMQERGLVSVFALVGMYATAGVCGRLAK